MAFAKKITITYYYGITVITMYTYTIRLSHLALILGRLGTVLDTRTPHPNTGIDQNSKVSIYDFYLC